MALVKKIYRKAIKEFRKRQNKNVDFTIICDSCVAGVVYNELGVRFQTPTINLYIKPDDFIRFVSNLKYYIAQDLERLDKEGFSFPVGILDDVEIFFMHYHSFEDAKDKWDKRKRRINPDNIFVVMTENEGCDLSHLKQFDKLEYHKKVVFTHQKYAGIKSAFYIRGFENYTELGNIIDDSDKIGKRYYDQFPWVKWLNN